MTHQDVQKAREWLVVNIPSLYTAPRCGLTAAAHVDMLAAYRHDSLVEELEGLAKEYCTDCRLFGPEHFGCCDAMPIRRRIAALQQEEL